MSDRPETEMWAFVATLVGGVLIVMAALMGAFMMSFVGPFSGGMVWMMGGYAPSPGWLLGMGAWMVLWGVATGAVVIAGAVRIRAGGPDTLGWGVAVVVAACLSLFAMGGFLFGAVLAVVGGVVAIAAASSSRAPAGRRVA
ncbi:MAG TPA: hypothetical protein VI997_06810 [Candidatus Thermoplasmatota archaeon]|nr:hypothetical protein [Candidatus Thermoplasmatota archaeon]